VAGSSFTVNGLVNLYLIKNNYIQPLTEYVGSFNQATTFLGTFIIFLILLILTGVAHKKYFVFAKP